ncbi:MAG: hypothetical protein JWN04_1968 [Myxococcaceae bacterium]|nr:hypothetical protein [Myxococcaceae bacterium]
MLVGALVVHLPTRQVHAQGTRFSQNNYTLDLVTTPVLGGGRILGMAGAHVAIASGIDGAAFNPAGYAERYEKEVDWFAFDVTGGLSLSNVFTQNDFDNDGKTNKSSGTTRQVSLGARIQLSYGGTGINWLQRRYSLRGEAGRNFDVTLDTWRTGLAYSFLNGGLVVGTTLSIYKFSVAANGSDSTFSQLTQLTPFGNSKNPTGYRGFGAEFGVLLRPAKKRYRLGFVATTPVHGRLAEAKSADPDGVRRAQGLVLPQDVHVPWQVATGVAYQFGERRTNTPWRNTKHLRHDLAQQIAEGTYQAPEAFGEAPYQKLPSDPEKALDVAMANWSEYERRLRRHQPRRYVLLAADVLMYGRTDNGHGIDAFLNQTPERSGQKISYGARVGIESEVWPDRLKVRGGTYLEPSRFKRSDYRPHATTGFDVRLFDLWRWSVRGTATADLAPRYFNWGIAFGLWW